MLTGHLNFLAVKTKLFTAAVHSPGPGASAHIRTKRDPQRGCERKARTSRNHEFQRDAGCKLKRALLKGTQAKVGRKCHEKGHVLPLVPSPKAVDSPPEGKRSLYWGHQSLWRAGSHCEDSAVPPATSEIAAFSLPWLPEHTRPGKKRPEDMFLDNLKKSKDIDRGL